MRLQLPGAPGPQWRAFQMGWRAFLMMKVQDRRGIKPQGWWCPGAHSCVPPAASAPLSRCRQPGATISQWQPQRSSTLPVDRLRRACSAPAVGVISRCPRRRLIPVISSALARFIYDVPPEPTGLGILTCVNIQSTLRGGRVCTFSFLKPPRKNNVKREF